jgi:phosphatidylinositol alpha-mannosyltransferase
VHHTALELRALGHATDVVTSRFSREKESAPGVLRVGTNVMVPCLGALANMNTGVGVRREVEAILRRNEYDIIHVHEPLSPLLPWIALEAAPEEAAVVGTFHACTPRALPYRLFRPILKRYERRLDARIAVSATARRSVARFFAGHYRVLPNGVDPTRFRPDVAPLEIADPSRPTILFLGRFYPRKGLAVLFQALPKIARAIPELRVLLAGSGPLLPWCRGLARRAPCEVHLLGEIPAEDVPRAYRSADVFVAPSTGQESFGIVHLEAMASGIPIVASDIEGYRETLTNGAEALLFPNRDATALSHAVLRVLQSKELARSMSRAGRSKAKRYSWQRITRELESLYLESLDRKRRIQLAS